MSIKVMTMVWDAYPASGSELLAMLAMADWCNDAGGSLYPSMGAVADKIRVSEKQARRIVQCIVERGYMRVIGNEHGGKPGSTKHFQIEVGKLRDLVLLKESARTAPASVTPPAGVTPPVDGSRTPPTQGIDPSHGCPSTPPMGGSLTVNEPSIEPLEGEGEAPEQIPRTPPMTGAICMVMKACGMQSVNPSHPDLQILIDKGADIGMFAQVARDCVTKGKSFVYALAVIKGQMTDAAALANTAMSKPAAMTANRQAHKHAGAAAAIWGNSTPEEFIDV